MPKQKTHKGLKKRISITVHGKVKRKQAGKSHLNAKKSARRRRHLRATVGTTKANVKRLTLLLAKG